MRGGKLKDTDRDLRGHNGMPSNPRLVAANIDLLDVRDRFLPLPILCLERVPEPGALVIAVKASI
jgi:hypothetical protein